MIRAQNVYKQIITTHAFAVVVGNVGREISFLAVLADHNTIFLVTEIGCAKPGSAVFFIQHVPFLQNCQCVVDQVVVAQTLFREPTVESHAKLSKIVFHFGANRFK